MCLTTMVYVYVQLRSACYYLVLAVNSDWFSKIYGITRCYSSCLFLSVFWTHKQMTDGCAQYMQHFISWCELRSSIPTFINTNTAHISMLWLWQWLTCASPSSPFPTPELVELTSSGDGIQTREWILVGMADSNQLGSPKRLAELEKMK